MQTLIHRIVSAVLSPITSDPDLGSVRLSVSEVTRDLDHGRDGLTLSPLLLARAARDGEVTLV